MLKIDFAPEDIGGDHELADFFTMAMDVGIPFTIFPKSANGWPILGFETDEVTERLDRFLEYWFGKDYDEFVFVEK